MRLGSGIDFASRRFSISSLMLILCLVVTTLALLFCQQIFYLENEKSTLTRRLNSARAKENLPPLEAVSNSDLDVALVAAVNVAIAQLNAPWAPTLEAIAKRRPPEVSVLQLEPYATERRLRLVIEGNDSAMLFGFAAALVDKRVFVSMTPVSQQRVEGEGHSGLKLTVDLEWLL